LGVTVDILDICLNGEIEIGKAVLVGTMDLDWERNRFAGSSCLRSAGLNIYLWGGPWTRLKYSAPHSNIVVCISGV
jgi:hypothetical protein